MVRDIGPFTVSRQSTLQSRSPDRSLHNCRDPPQSREDDGIQSVASVIRSLWQPLMAGGTMHPRLPSRPLVFRVLFVRTAASTLAFCAAAATSTAAQIDLTPGFDPGPAPEMQRLAFLEGGWRVTPQFGTPGQPGTWTPTAATRTEFIAFLAGTFLRSELSVTWPDGQVWKTVSVWSYDRFREEYRVGILDDLWGLFDVYEGGFDGDELKVSNERARTWGPAGSGPPAMARVVLKEIEPGIRFVLEWEGSTDGQTWVAAGLRWIYERTGPDRSP
jgi:hypothetical protein